MNKIVLLLTIFVSFNVLGQNNLTYKDIDKLDRATIIRLGQERITGYLKLIKDSSFDYSLIDTIRILKNKKKYFVRFEQLIKYVPMNTNYYYGFNVDLLDNDIHRILLLNNNSVKDPIRFFHPKPQDLEKIKFVQNSLTLDVIYESIIIREKEDYYEIGYASSGEKMDKISGNTFDWWDEVIYIDPDEKLIDTKIK